MHTLVKGGVIITDADLLVLNNDLMDADDWVMKAVAGKVNSCRKRMVRQWVPVLLNDPSIESIPGDVDSLIAMIVARPDYKNRAEKELETEND